MFFAGIHPAEILPTFMSRWYRPRFVSCTVARRRDASHQLRACRCDAVAVITGRAGSGGVDPRYSPVNPNSAGLSTLPQCASTPCLPPFDNVKNGGYPIWSIYRMLYDYTDPTSLAANLASLAKISASTLYGDFVPASSLSIFHSHFPQVVTSFGDH